MYDIIVAGAGFTGLSAALDLKRRGARILVLEARDRVGGRVESVINGLGERVDTGGQFTCDDMINIMALLGERGHALVSPRFEGIDISVPPTPSAQLTRISQGAMAIRDRYNRISPSDPTIAGLSVADWLERQPEDRDAKAAFRSMIEGLWCMALEDLPLWHLIDNDRRITNEQYELQHYPARTLHALAKDLATDLGDALRLSTPVASIEVGDTGVTVFTPKETFAARSVLIAMPPSMTARLTYAPALPAQLARALSVWRSGAVIKLVLRYERAFWRDKGLSGVVMWRDPVGLFACDTGTADRPTLSAFVGGPLALEWRERGMDAVRQDMLERLAAALGSEAATPLDATVRDWCHDPWSGGAYSDLVVDMHATDAETVIAAGAPPLFFACSEISPSFPGYVEGAIVAGRMAAERILSRLAAQSASATSASGS